MVVELFLRFLLLVTCVGAFSPSQLPLASPPSRNTRGGSETYHQPNFSFVVPSKPIVRGDVKCAMMLPAFVRSSIEVSPAARNAILLGAAATAVYRNRQKLFFPGASSDPEFSEPLPDGSYGCPFFGSNVLKGTSEFGPGAFYKAASKKLGNPGIFKLFFFGKPMVNVSGLSNMKKVLGSEFKGGDNKGVEQSTGSKGLKTLLGSESLVMQRQSDEHKIQRRLVGASMSPEAIKASLPAIQKTAEEQVERVLLAGSPVVMGNVCTDFTLDIAWRQILGLNLKKEEVHTFHKAMGDWIKGLFTFRSLLPFVKLTRCYEAKKYLESKIQSRIRTLKEKGPDGLTALSAMLFARDEDSNRRLTTQQVIDNALVLMIAGSETSASTLTNAMLFLGKYPEVRQRIIEEQHALVAKHGATFTMAQLENECPYLEAVIKETMRIKPLAGGMERVCKGTMVVQGKQIPKGWKIVASSYLTHQEDPMTKIEDGSHMEIEGFNPDRWLDDATRPSSHFVPFGLGPRHCIGGRLAMVEMKVFLASFFRKADFNLAGNADAPVAWKKHAMIPKPADGVVITPIAL